MFLLSNWELVCIKEFMFIFLTGPNNEVFLANIFSLSNWMLCAIVQF